MIGFLILAALGAAGYAATRANNPGASSSPVIKQATGASLSTALGSSSKPAGYYASGNPQYNNQTPPMSLVRPRPTSFRPIAKATTANQKPVVVIPVKGTSAAPRPGPQDRNTRKPVIAGLVNTRQQNRQTTAPELAQPFWTKPNYGRK